VIDPASGLDGVRSVGVAHGEIVAISADRMSGREVIDAEGLIVAPGFIDLHQHAWDETSLALKAQDGVTSIFELEVGTADVAGWYREREGNSLINFGVSVGHIPVRMAVMGDAPAFLPPSDARAGSVEASSEQIDAMARELTQGLEEGAVAVGFGLAYTPVATDEEVLRMFRVAAQHHASCHMHLRGRAQAASTALVDMAHLASLAQASLHVVHLQATGSAQTPELLRLIDGWQAAQQDVSSEVYPWTAGMTEIKSAIFGEGWQQRLGISYSDLQWGATGERLDEDSFQRYREQGGLVIVHNNKPEAVDYAVTHPSTMIASDGLAGHPRNAGTYARILGYYVRKMQSLELTSALAKMSLMPAQRLEPRCVAMRRKGRIQLGCDADLTIFDPETVDSLATYENSQLASAGIPWVIVNGTPVVREGQLVGDVLPGQAIRAGSTAR
jgi:N-acyl-D-aspartate/D-glutamate deacylase